MKVVFDMDDVLWDFNGHVCTKIGIDESKVVTFKVYENPYLSETDKIRLKNAYAEPKMFENIVWYPGIEKIHMLSDMGVDLYVNSNCCGQDIADLKAPQLDRVLRLPDGHITLNVIAIDSHTKKKDIGPDVDIFIDDNPHNVATSHAKLNIMPIKNWNNNERARAVVSEKNVIYLPSLNDILDLIIGKAYIASRV